MICITFNRKLYQTEIYASLLTKFSLSKRSCCIVVNERNSPPGHDADTKFILLVIDRPHDDYFQHFVVGGLSLNVVSSFATIPDSLGSDVELAVACIVYSVHVQGLDFFLYLPPHLLYHQSLWHQSEGCIDHKTG